MEKIYKSCTAGITDKQFELYHADGVATYISFERLMKQTIGENLKPNERIKGMVITTDGITLYLETK